MINYSIAMMGNPAKKQDPKKAYGVLSTPRNHFFCDNNFIKTLGLFDSFFYIYSSFASGLSTGQELLPFLQVCC